MDVTELSPAQCVLLTVHLASDSNIKALHSFTSARLDVLEPEIVLRILLTYLPEAVDPREYLNYVEEVASRLYINDERENVEVNVAVVRDMTEEQARRRIRKLRILKITPPHFPSSAPTDLLTNFLCHRAYRIDSQTGLLNLIPPLIERFINRNDFIRQWYISIVLPLVRLQVDYYPEDGSLAMPLLEFEKLSGQQGVDVLLRKSGHLGESGKSSRPNLGRDIKSLVGPWMYGHTDRRRKLLDRYDSQNGADEKEPSGSVGKISLDGVGWKDKTGHSWEYTYQWLVQRSIDDLALVASAIDDWNGPGDVDLGRYEQGSIHYLDEDLERKLQLQYAQAAFACCYAAQADDRETIRAAHSILARLASLLEFIPPPDLATSVDSLPRLERHASKLKESRTVADLMPSALLLPEHPLSTPRLETYMLLQMLVYSAYQLSGLDHPFSLYKVARLHFYANVDEQMEVFKRLLHHLAKARAYKDETQWMSDRATLLWLWNWGIEPDPETPSKGAGVLGEIPRDDFDRELLKVFIDTSNYQLAIKLYTVETATSKVLSKSQVEEVVVAQAMEAYDNASNGNRSRGSMKKASDIIAAFRPFFPNRGGFERASALIAATHALSFYSLTLQHGVPFQPVSIRVSQDPLSLISKVLEQNPGSYTKLDDLIAIAQNLVTAMVAQNSHDGHDENTGAKVEHEGLAQEKKDARQRVTFAAVEAALREDDFETAYSYIVSRLKPSEAVIDAPSSAKGNEVRKHNHFKRSSQDRSQAATDDISWRAAFLAGRYRPSNTSPTLRRLEQRTELLSLALLLAPVSALTEILTAWRRCEEEMTALQRAQQQAEEDFDDRADKRLSGESSALPGNFNVGDEQPALILNQRRRELGRMGATYHGGDDTPLSMFDLTRNAARAFSQNAFPLRGAVQQSGDRELSTAHGTGGAEAASSASPADGHQRIRKRDFVANVAANSLASGLGWVLGATPTAQQRPPQDG